MHQAGLKGVNGKGGLRICLPAHCLSAPPDLQPYCHTNATSHSLLKHDQSAPDNRLRCGDIVLSSGSPRECRNPLFAYPLHVLNLPKCIHWLRTQTWHLVERQLLATPDSLGDGPNIGADFWEGDATKHFSVKKGFSVKGAGGKRSGPFSEPLDSEN